MRTGNISIAGKRMELQSLTSSEIAALTTPLAGTQIYDSTLGVVVFYNGSAWIAGVGDHKVVVSATDDAPGYLGTKIGSQGGVISERIQHHGGETLNLRLAVGTNLSVTTDTLELDSVPYFRATGAQNQSGTVANALATWSAGTLKGTGFDRLNGIYTVPRTGIYVFTMQVAIQTSVPITTHHVYGLRGGPIADIWCNLKRSYQSLDTEILTRTATVPCAGGDEITAQWYTENSWSLGITFSSLVTYESLFTGYMLK